MPSQQYHSEIAHKRTKVYALHPYFAGFFMQRPSLTKNIIAAIIIIIVIICAIASRLRASLWFRHLSNCSELGHI